MSTSNSSFLFIQNKAALTGRRLYRIVREHLNVAAHIRNLMLKVNLGCEIHIYQMIEFGKLTKEEGLYLMVNTLADENHRLNQMCNDLIMRMPSRLLVETIAGEK